jgi:hypothetical protein
VAKNRREQANDDPVAYLRAAGWKQLSVEERPCFSRCWIEPGKKLSSAAKEGPKTIREIVLPGKTKSSPPRIIEQTVVPGMTWICTLEEAVRIQLLADSGKPEPTSSEAATSTPSSLLPDAG